MKAEYMSIAKKAMHGKEFLNKYGAGEENDDNEWGMGKTQTMRRY